MIDDIQTGGRSSIIMECEVYIIQANDSKMRGQELLRDRVRLSS